MTGLGLAILIPTAALAWFFVRRGQFPPGFNPDGSFTLSRVPASIPPYMQRR